MATSFFILFEDIIKNWARWSESYNVKFSDKSVGSYSLTIRIADFKVIGDGVVICGKREFKYIKSKKSDTSQSRS